MKEERKKIIRFALDFDIQDIHTYSGYKGDLIVKVVTKEKEALSAIRSFALSLGVKEVVIKQNVDMGNYEIFCITVDEQVYALKTIDILDEVHSDHLVENHWDKKK
ncbi:MAG: hypothetical protein PHQ22_09360 [Sulfuricurvum sp.]|nr:hypothetical protein [Sulfuricurvum sp.]MDD5387386.1 hypothetical protein [Sulfuricurvum sp.]